MRGSSTSWRIRVQRIGLIGGPALGLLTFVALPSSFETAAGDLTPFSAAGRATMALMVWMAAWWLTEAVDISATALLPIVVLPLIGAATIGQATAPYGSDLIFLFMGGFILALSMQRWGLDRRIALITLRIVGAKPKNMVAGFMIATAMISGFVSNTATAAMMMPVGLSVIELVRKRRDSADVTSISNDDSSWRNFALCLMLGIAYASSIGGVATIIGTPPNVFMVGFIERTIDPAYRQEIGFGQWMLIGVPLVLVFLPLTWVLLTSVLFPIRMKQVEGGRAFLNQAYRELGPMNRGEVTTFIVFIAAALLWIARPWLATLSFGAGQNAIMPMRGLSDPGIAMTAAMLLFAIPVNWRTRTFTMDWQHAARLPWGILILFGGGLSLGAAIEANGVAEFIGNQATRFNWLPSIAIIIIVTAAVVFFSELASNTATAMTLIPIFAAMAPALGIHPYLLVVAAGLAASCAFMMPVGTPPNAIVFGTGYVSMAEMIKAGFWLNLIGILLITLLCYFVAMPVLS